MSQLALHLEYTLLRPGCTATEVTELCRAAVAAHYFGVCVPSCYVQHARAELGPASTRLVTVAGFPFGYANLPSKRYEIEQALRDGADEVDLVANHSFLRSGNVKAYRGEIHLLARLTQASGRKIKVIIEYGLLTADELRLACEVCAEERVDFVKTSSGMAGSPVSVAQIQQLRTLLPPSMGIKASGGVRTREQAAELLAAGAHRIGTSALL